jgi:hypothetical protein
MAEIENREKMRRAVLGRTMVRRVNDEKVREVIKKKMVAAINAAVRRRVMTKMFRESLATNSCSSANEC